MSHQWESPVQVLKNGQRCYEFYPSYDGGNWLIKETVTGKEFKVSPLAAEQYSEALLNEGFKNMYSVRRP